MDAFLFRDFGVWKVWAGVGDEIGEYGTELSLPGNLEAGGGKLMLGGTRLDMSASVTCGRRGGTNIVPGGGPVT